MFSELFKHFTDAEQLLSLEPEELAGYLLVSLDGIEQIFLDSVISHNDMEYEINRNSHLNYPYKCRDDVLFALMEAWQCLVCQGFVAPIPKSSRRYNTYEVTTYFVTRRGKEIETLDDFEDYRKRDLLRKHHLHPIIADKVWRIFAQGSYDTAVLEAFKQVEIAVRKTGGYTKSDYGTKLMGNAFNVNNGKVTDENLHEAEKEGMRNLFLGAIGLYKNPSSHHEVEFAPEAAAEIIIIASHLLRIVDTCKGLNSNSPTS